MDTLCLLRIITQSKSAPALNLTIGLSSLTKLLDILENSDDVVSYTAHSDVSIGANFEDYCLSFGGVHPPSFRKWRIVHLAV